jgi:hypothetical protein
MNIPERKKKGSVQNAVRAFLQEHPNTGFTPREISDKTKINYFSVGDALNMLAIRDDHFVITRGEGTTRGDGLKAYYFPVKETSPILNETLKPGESFSRLRNKKFQKRVQTALIEFMHGFADGEVEWSTPGHTIKVTWKRHDELIKVRCPKCGKEHTVSNKLFKTMKMGGHPFACGCDNPTELLRVTTN